jgi:hypothetical protein
MKDWIKLISAGGAVAGFIVLILLIAPAVAIWAINSLAEAGGAEFYIDHTLWNYFVMLVTLVLVNGSTSNSK